MRSGWARRLLPATVMCGAAALAQPAAVRELVLVDGALPAAQRLIVVAQGQVQRWRLTSNVAGEVHVHAYRVSVALRPGVAAELAFTAHATGRFRVEWHPAGGTVAAAPHHDAPVATLEVRPR